MATTSLLVRDITTSLDEFNATLFGTQPSTLSNLTRRLLTFNPVTDKTAFAATVSSPNTVSVSSESTVHNSTQWTARLMNNQDLKPDVTEIDVKNLLSNSSNKEELGALYSLYNLSMDANWKTFKTYTVFPSSEENKHYDSVLGSDYKSVLMSFAKNENFVPYTFRTLMRLYIRMYSFNVALALMDANPDSNAVTKLKDAIYLLTQKEAVNMKSLSSDLSKELTGGMTRFNTITSTMQMLSDSHEDARRSLKSQSEIMQTGINTERALSKYWYFAVGVLVVCSILSVGSAMSSLPTNQKLTTMGASVLLSVISMFAIILTFTRNNTVERFSGGDSAITSSQTAFLNEVKDYMASLGTIFFHLQSYRALSSSTYGISKEHRYFKDHEAQLRNMGNKYNAANRATDLYNRKHGASVYLFIVLAMLISAVTLAYVAAGQYSSFTQPYVIAVASVLAFVIVALYILDITSYVRTDGNKKYWQSPSTDKL